MIKNFTTPVLGFAAASGTGKTTLLEQVIPVLKNQGLTVGLIKHSHHDFQIDKPGKDSFRLRAAGASPVLLVSGYRRAMITELSPGQESSLQQELKQFGNFDLDLILVEGFSTEAFPKIELHRAVLNKPFLFTDDDTIIAVAADCPLNLPEPLIALDINKPMMIAHFIQHQFINHHD
jgi:molybdopterin-guanine dinucleotide biosynthesis protein B